MGPGEVEKKSNTRTQEKSLGKPKTHTGTEFTTGSGWRETGGTRKKCLKRGVRFGGSTANSGS